MRIKGTKYTLNSLNAKLNPICHLLALLEAHTLLHVSRISVNQEWPLHAIVNFKLEAMKLISTLHAMYMSDNSILVMIQYNLSILHNSTQQACLRN
jgi:hypothetical protein